MIEDVSRSAAVKEARLVDWLVSRGSIAIGFSGGVDSAYLAAVAVESLGGDRVVGIIGRSASYPEAQWKSARAVADGIGLDVIEIDTDELDDPRYAANPSNRCYFCKSELWSRVVPLAHARGIPTVADGTNADDLTGHRPGALAAKEQGVVSPLAMFALTKAEIRDRSKARGLATWAQPSSPCLSSRIPYGTPVTVARLRRVEDAESALRALGVAGDLRVRHFGTKARVEMGLDEMSRWSEGVARQRLNAALLAVGYEEIEIDQRGFRSGALNELSTGASLSRH
ncbi:MAG TPA: ATP-dependent sacrificial sulfur transferase LarE [Gemmatimonadaceae bacterium]|nr:ATP-dependent sacrificial sulfur transferase LarE [Gemmatimonadaceae bacterium]